ncbi:MAG: hypothetical protein AAGH65_06895 [Pseudomonadota bacterium]
MTAAALCVVVPLGPDDQAWRTLLPRLSALPETTELVLSACAEPPPDWAALVDSSPFHSMRWLHTQPGRAQQLNAGIEASHASTLWLLHADSQPNAINLEAVLDCTTRSQSGWWYFDLQFDGPSSAFVQLNARGATLRSRWFAQPFGDQGWVLSREVFEQVGAFDQNWVRGEDLEWTVRAKRIGHTPQALQSRLITSARRYREHGWLRTTLRHWLDTLVMNRRARQQIRMCS